MNNLEQYIRSKHDLRFNLRPGRMMDQENGLGITVHCPDAAVYTESFDSVTCSGVGFFINDMKLMISEFFLGNYRLRTWTHTLTTHYKTEKIALRYTDSISFIWIGS